MIARIFVAIGLALCIGAAIDGGTSIAQNQPIPGGTPPPIGGQMAKNASNAALPDALGNLGLPIYNVMAYGAKCDSTGGVGTDDTTAINNAAAAMRTHGFGILYSPPDRYCYHTGTINLTNLNSAVGSNPNQKTRVSLHLMCAAAASTCVDGIGDRHTTFNDFELLTTHFADCSAGDDAAVGLQYGRPNPTQVASQIDFISHYINGCFSAAAVINYASEVSKSYGGVINNGSLTAGSHNVRVDCDNHFNILASAFATISWTSGIFASCNDISFHGTASQKGVTTLTATGESGVTLTFASVPATIVAGQIVHDNTTLANLPNGTHVVSTTATTVVLNNSVTSVVNGDKIQFSSPDPAVWIDGVWGFTWDGNGYISTGSEYAVTLFYESAHPNISVHLPVHIESSPNLVGDVLSSGTGTAPIIYDFQREDYEDNSTFAVVVPDFANGVQTTQLDHLRMTLKPVSDVSATFHDFGLYQQVNSAVVASGGSGCTPDGATTFTLVGGNGYPAATVNGTVTAGVLGGALTVPRAGAYQVTPGTTPSTTGGGCSVQPTITPTYGNATTQVPILANGIVTNSSNNNRSIPGSVNGLISNANAGGSAFIGFLGTQIIVPNLALATGTGQSRVCRDSGNLLSRCAARALVQAQPANPAGTADATGKMMGLAVAFTPTESGKLILTISGNISTDTSGDGAKVQASYGTGTAPANAAAITGTQCGSRPTLTGLTGVLTQFFTVNCAVSGLTVGTAYWIDVTLAAITGGTASLSNLSVSAIEP